MVAPALHGEGTRLTCIPGCPSRPGRQAASQPLVTEVESEEDGGQGAGEEAAPGRSRKRAARLGKVQAIAKKARGSAQPTHSGGGRSSRLLSMAGKKSQPSSSRLHKATGEPPAGGGGHAAWSVRAGSLLARCGEQQCGAWGQQLQCAPCTSPMWCRRRRSAQQSCFQETLWRADRNHRHVLWHVGDQQQRGVLPQHGWACTVCPTHPPNSIVSPTPTANSATRCWATATSTSTARPSERSPGRPGATHAM